MKLLLIILLVVFYATPISAKTDAGSIGSIKGSGVLERGKDVIEGNEGVNVQSMDTAVTARGRMQINFIDETRVDITEHSRLLIDEFVYDPANDIGSLSIKASLGTVRYASGQIAKKYQQNVKIRTPSATIGVRGTDFIMVVDEMGGSMITLLPSCDAAGMCFTGEIQVETDAGFVVMNQAFQTTMTQHPMRSPTPPLVIDVSEQMINHLLILRKKGIYEEEEDEIRRRTRKMFEFLDIDALEFDDLEKDALVDDIKNIWVTDLDRNHYYLQELLHDMLDQLNLALAAFFRDQLDKENEEFFAIRQSGYDEKTRITFIVEEPNYRVIRDDTAMQNHLDITVSDQYGVTIDMEQGDEAVYDYQIGVGSNTISIKQSN